MDVEIERKFRLPEGVEVTSLGEDHLLGDTRHHSLRAVYFDTPDLLLARSGTTLRRRTGGSDEGWHLKLPGEGDLRIEVHAPIVPGASKFVVPAALREPIADKLGQQPLIPVASLDTERTETDVVVTGESPVALLCQDEVTVTRGREVQTWQELEVELNGGTEEQLDAICEQLEELGATRQPQVPKLLQALGEHLTDESPAHEKPAHGEPTAARVVGGYIATQVGVIQAREAQVRVDAPESVHKMRVATRRLRSTLRTFRDLLDADRTEPLRVQVRELSEALGRPRDAEILKAHLFAAVDELPPEAIIGPVPERVRQELDARHDEALARLVEHLDGPGHQQLSEDLVRLLCEPAFLPEADGPASEVLPPLLKKATRRVTHQWDQSEAAEGEERMELAHGARKKAKAARYAWEAVAPAFGHAPTAVTAWEQVTETLGTAQDAVVARACLLELAEAAAAVGEPTFTYGVLWEREREHQDAARGAAAGAIRAAREASTG